MTTTHRTFNGVRRARKLSVPEDAIEWAFHYFYHLDHSDAAIHCAKVRYSPITFRLAELLSHTELLLSHTEFLAVYDVLEHLGAYEEDKGR